MTYGQAQALLDDPSANSPVAQGVKDLAKIARILRYVTIATAEPAQPVLVPSRPVGFLHAAADAFADDAAAAASTHAVATAGLGWCAGVDELKPVR